jgi:hypothetical protein
VIRGKGRFRGGKELGKGQEGVGEEQGRVGGALFVEENIMTSRCSD